MEQLKGSFAIKVALIFLLAVPLNSVTVNPALCPTNKIAPHRRIASWERPQGRTFAAYYDLLSPTSPGSPNRPHDQASLQDQPQSDQSNDCGDIEDYDENDLSSVTPQKQNRNSRADNRWFHGFFGNRPPYQLPAYKPPTTTTTTTTTTTKAPANVPSHHGPQYPQRPPYWSGGLLSNNYYHPQIDQTPSDNLKPVHESSDISEVQQSYRPDVVGGPVYHVVGHTRPTVSTQDEALRRRLEYIDRMRRLSTQPTYMSVNRSPRPRKLTNDNTVIGSFFDLLFK